MLPLQGSEELVACLQPDRVRFERFADGGHNLLIERPKRVLALMEEFILQGEGTA